ncbi:hypothetical protein CBR_g32582 [Chara braunii]|uniref:Right handed beta helix domain-containing protein n=1 Tax=Chara braunii TaxID=69332 RepID=A0A388LGX6_CHABU|nr:hypothetical protein CBR_g32582 [Chara braunii]|eukprot:GBG81590.1 hypothetical protein CBR_g32582 [Chara braunii]
MGRFRKERLVAAVVVVAMVVLSLAKPSDGRSRNRPGATAAAHGAQSRAAESARRSLAASSAAEIALAKAITESNGKGKGKVIVLKTDVILTKALPVIPYQGQLVIRGECGKRKCVIDGAKKFGIFVTYTPGCLIKLENLEIRQAKDGAVSGKCNVVIKNCLFRANRGAPVVALGIGDPTFDISNTVFIDNQSNSSCGALCSNSRGGGKLQNCSFIRNTANDDGGAVYLWGVGEKPLMITNCLFESNSALRGSGGAMFIEPNGIENWADVYVMETKFKGNQAKTMGGAVTLVSDLKAHFCGGVMSGNKALSGKGNDLALVSGGPLPVFVNFCPYPPKLSVYGVPSIRQHAVVDSCRLCGGPESFPFN